MAASAVRSTRVGGPASTTGAAARPKDRSPAVLGLALGVAVLYAMFAEGAIGVPQESVLQMGIAAVALATLAALLYGRGLRASAGARPWPGWRCSPPSPCGRACRLRGRSHPTRAGSSSTARWPTCWSPRWRWCWARASRARPRRWRSATWRSPRPWRSTHSGGSCSRGSRYPGLLDLDHTDRFSRLRAPLGYWNALGLACAMAVPIGLRATVALSGRARTAALFSLVTVAHHAGPHLLPRGPAGGGADGGRGAGGGPRPAAAAAFGGVALLGAAPAVVCVLLLDDLKTDGLSASARTPRRPVAGAGGGRRSGHRLPARQAALQARRDEAERPCRHARAASRPRGRGGAAAGRARRTGAVGPRDRRQRSTTSSTSSPPRSSTLRTTPSRVLRTNSGNRWVWWQEAAGRVLGPPGGGPRRGLVPAGAPRLPRQRDRGAPAPQRADGVPGRDGSGGSAAGARRPGAARWSPGWARCAHARPGATAPSRWPCWRWRWAGWCTRWWTGTGTSPRSPWWR